MRGWGGQKGGLGAVDRVRAREQACERKRERGRERKRGREGGREKGKDQDFTPLKTYASYALV